MKKVFNSILNFINKFSLIFTIVCLSIATFSAIFLYITSSKTRDYLNPLVLILMTIISILAIIKIYKFIKKLNEKQKKITCTLLIITQFILLFISSQFISSKPQVDLMELLIEINSLNSNGTILDSAYFSLYPNNTFLVTLLYGINKISPNHYELLFDLASCLSITIMSFFIYKTAKKMYDTSKALMALLFCVFSPIFYLYVSYYYTDIFMLPFASILTYLIVVNQNKNETKKGLLNCIYIGIIAAIGYKIRVISLFVLIAYFVYLIFKKNPKKLIKTFIPIIISLILSLNLIDIAEKQIFTNLDNSKSMPLTHWLMMGMNAESNGTYNHEDFILSTSIGTKEEIQKTNIHMIKQRIINQGIFKNIGLLINKVILVWGKGDYLYQKYLTHVKDFNISYRYLVEDENIIINYFLQTSKIVILLLSLYSLITQFKKKENSILGITIFGGIIFYLFWEANPRYGLSFLPWLILLTTPSYNKIKIDLNKYKYFNSFKKYLIFLTIIILGYGFIQYTNVQERSNIISKNNIETHGASKSIKYIKLEKDISLTQEIKLYDTFNEINLKFKFFQKDINKDFTLELLNSKEETLYKKNILFSDLINTDFTSFKLEKSLPKGTYIIKLTQDKESSLEVAATYEKHYDFYANGKLLINEIEQPEDIMFEIKNIEKRGLYSYLEYIIFVITILGIEYIILFWKEGSKNEK